VESIKLDNYQHVSLALQMGLNYLDMAPAYNQGQCEEAYGKLLAGSSARREKVYLMTKISSFNRRLGQMYQDVFNGLPQEIKKNAILQRATELRRERGVEKPGYHINYFSPINRTVTPWHICARRC
jgi:hypothetical protein